MVIAEPLRAKPGPGTTIKSGPSEKWQNDKTDNLPEEALC